MKVHKIHLFGLWLLTCGNCLGQGIVNFNNNIAAGGDHRVYICYPNQPVVGTNYLAELYYVDPADSVLKPVPVSISKFRVTSTASPGTWSGKTVTFPAAIGGVNVPVQLEVRVWDSLIASTYEAALAAGGGFIGQSAPFFYTQTSSNPPAVTDTEMLNMPLVSISAGCPEPSVVVLSFLGTFLFIIFRKKSPLASLLLRASGCGKNGRDNSSIARRGYKASRW